MQITAQGKMDADAIKALNHVLMFGKKEPKKQFTLRCAMLLVLFALFVIYGVTLGFDAFVWLFLFACGVCLLLQCYLYFLLPNLHIKAMGQLLGCVNQYEFDEEIFSVTSDTPEFNGTSQINYALVKKVYETGKYIFLVMTNHTTYIVNRDSFDHESQKSLQELLCKKIEKYIYCNY